MTVAEILEQAQLLSPQERKELVKMLVDSLDVSKQHIQHETSNLKTGAQIAAMLEQMEPIEFVDPEITDPTEWVKAQRQKEADRLKPYWNGEM